MSSIFKSGRKAAECRSPLSMLLCESLWSRSHTAVLPCIFCLLNFPQLQDPLSISMTQLPDPTIDQDWSGYDGSIQWHFSENAKKYPGRTCVVETKSSEGPERSFTYKQI